MSLLILVLVGAPAAGKTTVGEAVARGLGVPHLDLDTAVERRFGLSRAEVYADGGEAAFLAAEESLALAALGQPVVLSLSSSSVESATVRDALTGRTVVWLDVSAQYAARRLGLASLGVPTLVRLRATMELAMRERAPRYAAVAAHRIDTDRLGIDAVVDQVLAVLEGVQQGAQT